MCWQPGISPLAVWLSSGKLGTFTIAAELSGQKEARLGLDEAVESWRWENRLWFSNKTQGGDSSRLWREAMGEAYSQALGLRCCYCLLTGL